MASDWMNVPWLDARVLLIALVLWIILLKVWEGKGTLDKWNASRALGFILMIRTHKGQNALDRLAKPKAAWRAYGELSLWVCRFAMGLVLLLVLMTFVVSIISPPQRAPPSASELVAIPGLNPVIPLGWGAMAFIVSLVIHEYGHGLQARAHGMRVRSFGLLLLGPLPLGAFAEPQAEELTKAPSRERQRLFAAGPATNLFAALICMILLGVVASQFTANVQGVHAQSMVVDSGADEAGLEPYDSIISINGSATSDLNAFSSVMDGLQPNQSVPMLIKRASNGEDVLLNVTLGSKYQHYLDLGWQKEDLEAAGIEENSSFLGVIGLSEATNGIDRLAGPYHADWNGNAFSRILYSPVHLLTILVTPFDYSGVSIHPFEESKLSAEGFLGIGTLLFIVNMLFWLIWVNILLGFTNLIPMVPFDGGHMFRDMVHDGLTRLSKLGKKVKLWGGWHPMKIEHVAGKASVYSSFALLFMLLFTIIMPYMIN